MSRETGRLTGYVLAILIGAATAVSSSIAIGDVALAGGAKSKPAVQPAQAKIRFTGSWHTRFVTPQAAGWSGPQATTAPNGAASSDTGNAGHGGGTGKRLFGTYRPQFYFR